MVKGDDGADYVAGAGAAVFGGLASLLIWLTTGAGPVARYAWVATMLALIVAMKFLPARLAHPLIAVCYPVGWVAGVLLAGLLSLAPGGLAYMFSRTVVETFPRWLQVGILLAWFLLLAAVSLLLYSRTLRERLRTWLASHPSKLLRAFGWRERVAAWAAIVLYVDFVIVAMGCFAGVAFLLHGLSPPLFLPKARTVEHGSLADFLLWHLLDAIPGLKVPETIKWEAPLTYERPVAGWLVLLFKLMVIVPVVSGIGRYLRDEQKEAAEPPTAPPRIDSSAA